MRLAIAFLAVAVLLLVLTGCSKPTEEQQLEKFHRSVKYRSYRLVSEKAVKVGVASSAKANPGEKPMAAVDVHMVLSLLLSLKDSGEFALVEAEIAEASASEEKKVWINGLKAMALGRMKYPGLARQHYDELAAAVAGESGRKLAETDTGLKVGMMVVVMLGLQENESALAKAGAMGLDAACGLDYVTPLVGALAEAKQGHPLKATEQLRELSRSEKFSGYQREFLTETAQLLASNPDQEKLAEGTSRLLKKLAARVVGDIFSADNLEVLLDKKPTSAAQGAVELIDMLLQHAKERGRQQDGPTESAARLGHDQPTQASLTEPPSALTPAAEPR